MTRRQRAPASSACHLCRRCHGKFNFFFSFFFFFLLPPWSRAGCDFWVLSTTGMLIQEAGGEDKPLFQAAPEQGPVAVLQSLLLHWGQ